MKKIFDGYTLVSDMDGTLINSNKEISKENLDAIIKVEPYWNVKTTRKRWYAVFRRIKVEPYWNYIDSYVKIVI